MTVQSDVRLPALRWRRSARRSTGRTSVTLVAGLVILGAVVVLAVLAPLLTSFSPTQQDVAHALQPPGRGHLLGTDQLGRDLWSRLLYGGRQDLRIAFLVEVFPFAIGTALGLVAGYYGRWVDTVIMRLVDIVMAFPFYVLIIALVFVLGAGALSIYIAFTAISWIWYTRLVRGEVLVVRRQEYIAAARSAGLGSGRILLRHVLPNVVTQAIVFAMSDIVLNILGIVTLGFLGLGIQPPTPEWGQMVADGQQFITTSWQLATFPGVAVVVTALGLSLTADGLSDVLRPSA